MISVEAAEAHLVYANARVAYLEAKAAFKADADAGLKQVFIETRAELTAARDNWRLNYRATAGDIGDAFAVPEPVAVVANVEVLDNTDEHTDEHTDEPGSLDLIPSVKSPFARFFGRGR